MASSSPAFSECDEAVELIYCDPEEPIQCSVRQLFEEAYTARRGVGSEIPFVIIKLQEPVLNNEKRKKKKKPSGGRLGKPTSSGTSQLQGRSYEDFEMSYSTLSQEVPGSTSLKGWKRKLSRGFTGNVSAPKFKMIRRPPPAYQEDLPVLSPEDLTSGLSPTPETFTTIDSSALGTLAPLHPYSLPSHDTSAYLPTPPQDGGPWRPQAESPYSSDQHNFTVKVLAPDKEQRLTSSCKVEGNDVIVKPGHYFRLQFESPDLVNTEVRVSSYYTEDEGNQEPLSSCASHFDSHQKKCRLCCTMTEGHRPFLCSNNASLPIQPFLRVGVAAEDCASFTPLDTLVSSADPTKVMLKMTAICRNSCGPQKGKKKVALLVEARQRSSSFTQLETFRFTIRCCESPTRDSKPKQPKNVRRPTPTNPVMLPTPTHTNPVMLPSPTHTSLPQFVSGLCPDAPPSDCLDPGLVDDELMLSSVADHRFSPSHEIRTGEFEQGGPLQSLVIKTEACSSLLAANDHRQQMPDVKADFIRPPSASMEYFLMVKIDRPDQIERARQLIKKQNLNCLPGYKVHVP